MTPKHKVRHGHHVDDAGLIHYDDRETTIDQIEAVAGRRLDRRKSYAIIEGQVCDCGSWARECSGCNGNGCHECGYCGKRRESTWMPLEAAKGCD